MTVTKTRPEPVSYDEGLAYLYKYLETTHRSSAACLLMQEGEEFFVWEREGEPCYGFLRTYGAESTRPQDRKPIDLYNDFPPGLCVSLAIPFAQYKDHTNGKEEFYSRWFNGDLSPYKAALAQAELIDNGSQYTGMIFLDTDVDSSVLIQFLRQTRYIMSSANTFVSLRQKFPAEDSDTLFYASLFFDTTGSPTNNFAPVQKFCRGEYLKDITGGTFKNRYAYNRPEIDYIFGRIPPDEQFGKRLVDSSKKESGYPVYKGETALKLFKELLNAPPV